MEICLSRSYGSEFDCLERNPNSVFQHDVFTLRNRSQCRLIASLNGAEPIVDELWEEYKEFIGRRDYCINEEGKKLDGWDYFNERALRKLRRLDGLRCLGWRGEV